MRKVLEIKTGLYFCAALACSVPIPGKHFSRYLRQSKGL